MNMTDQQEKKLQKLRLQARNKFLKKYPEGFNDPKYIEQVRNKKLKAHETFRSLLGRNEFERLMQEEDYSTITKKAISAEKGTRLLVPSEETALKSIGRSAKNTKLFALALFNTLHSKLNVKEKFEQFGAALAAIQKKNKKIVSWPMRTAFSFLDSPEHHMYLKPSVIKTAAKKYGFDLFLNNRPNWNSYQSAYAFANQVKQDIGDLNPKDFIDLQEFMQVIASDRNQRTKK